MRQIDKSAVTFGLDVLQGKGEQKGKVKLGWSPQETAVGCRIRDYGSGVPHWSPLYGGSNWRAKEVRRRIGVSSVTQTYTNGSWMGLEEAGMHL